MFKKIASIICNTVAFIALIALFVEAYNYYDKYNVWVEEEDKNLILFMIPVGIVVAVVVILVGKLIRGQFKSTYEKKEVDYDKIRKSRISGIAFSAIGLILTLVITEEMVASFCIITLNMDWGEAAYGAGCWSAIKGYITIVTICELIDNIISACGSEEPYEERSNTPQKAPITTISTKKCPNCGFEQPSNRDECYKCGYKFGQRIESERVKPCPSCGAMQSEDQKFCSNCGGAMKEKVKYCTACGFAQPSGRTVCYKCGNKFETEVTKEVPSENQIGQEEKSQSENQTENEKKNTKMCPDCGFEQKNDRLVCFKCGHRFEDNATDAPKEKVTKFCNMCGTKQLITNEKCSNCEYVFEKEVIEESIQKAESEAQKVTSKEN